MPAGQQDVCHPSLSPVGTQHRHECMETAHHQTPPRHSLRSASSGLPPSLMVRGGSQSERCPPRPRQRGVPDRDAWRPGPQPAGGAHRDVPAPAAPCPGTSQGPAPWQRRLQRADGLLHASRLMLRPSNTRGRSSHSHAPDDLPLTSPSLVGSLEATCLAGGRAHRAAGCRCPGVAVTLLLA